MVMKKVAGIVGIILAAILLVLGFVSTTPDKYISSYGDNKMYEYVGGDAYNYIIEASLRGGEIAGAKAAKAIYFAAAGILFVLSLSFLTTDEGKDEIRSDIGAVKNEIRDAQKALTQSSETLANQQKQQLLSLKNIIELQEKVFNDNNDDNNDDAEVSE